MSKRGQFQGKKWLAHQKWGRKGSVCPKSDDCGQEMVGVSKNRAGRGPYVQKGTIPGKKGSAYPKTGQEGVHMSQKGMVPGKKGSAHPKLSRKGSKEGRF